MHFKALFFLTLLLITGQGSAALPVSIDGQALPSLAPMLEKATPAVVNIFNPGKSPG